MSTTSTSLIWSPPHNAYYWISYDAYGQPKYNFVQPEVPPAVPPAIQAANPQQPEPPTDPVPQHVRVGLPNLIQGDPRSWHEQLDQTYQMRTGREAQRFFIVGKVFAMLHTEAAGAQSVFDGIDEAYSFVRFGEIAYSSIRRFIVVDVRQGFVYACAISTYKNRGTLKSRCIPSEHAVVYFSGTNPQTCYFPGETGMTKEPIEVEPSDTSLVMKGESRIRFGKQFSIEMNVKVKDIGQVLPAHRSKFLNYYREYVGPR